MVGRFADSCRNSTSAARSSKRQAQTTEAALQSGLRSADVFWNIWTRLGRWTASNRCRTTPRTILQPCLSHSSSALLTTHSTTHLDHTTRPHTSTTHLKLLTANHTHTPYQRFDHRPSNIHTSHHPHPPPACSDHPLACYSRHTSKSFTTTTIKPSDMLVAQGPGFSTTLHLTLYSACYFPHTIRYSHDTTLYTPLHYTTLYFTTLHTPPHRRIALPFFFCPDY